MQSLENALSSYGLVLTSPLIMDGNIHRCGTAKRPRSNNGWYIVYDAGRAAVFGNWENGDGYEYWRDGSLPPASSQDIALAQERTRLLHEAREKEREDKSHEALEYIKNLPSEGFSEYLKRKKIYPHGNVKFDPKGNTLIIPTQDATGKIWSYQRIYPDGSKYFMAGGKVQGCYFPIFPARNVSKDELVVVCEGFATGSTIHEATKLPVIVAFNAGNLDAVCKSLPFTNLLIAADNDASRVGEDAAVATGYPYVMPLQEGWDFNDMHVAGQDIAGWFIPKEEAKTSGTPYQVHGLVGDIADWITSTAIRPQPALSLAAALAFVGMVKGHHVRGYTDLRTNLLILSLAPTSSGKEHPQNCIKRLALLSGLDAHMMSEPVSGGGFLKGLTKANRVGLLVMDEIGRYIGNLSNKNAGSWQREIIDYIIKTFSCANSTLKGRQYVDDKKNPTIDIFQPHFCCLGSTVAEKFQQACGSSEIIDGFLNRWVLFSSDERPDRQKEVRFAPPPEELLERIRALSQLRNYNPYGEPEMREVRFTPEAWDYFVEFRDRMDALIKTAPYPMDCLYARTAEHVEKIALTLSDSEDVLIADVRAAIAIVEQSNRSIAEFAGQIADNSNEQEFLRVQEIIRRAKDIKRGTLTRKTQFLQGGDRRRNEILNALLENNNISTRKVGTTIYYKWIAA